MRSNTDPSRRVSFFRTSAIELVLRPLRRTAAAHAFGPTARDAYPFELLTCPSLGDGTAPVEVAEDGNPLRAYLLVEDRDRCVSDHILRCCNLTEKGQ
jgi:hypothetical protein